LAAIVLKGSKLVKSMGLELATRAAALTAEYAIPKLTIVRIGDRPDDEAYERGAAKRCEALGIACDARVFSADISNEAFLDAFNQINGDAAIHGILVMSPLPAGIDQQAVKNMIDPVKDVDCMSPVNMAKIYSGDVTGHAPCTPSAVMELLRFNGINISGRRVVIVGRSLVVGRPLAMLMLVEHATLTICHTRTRELAAECRNADILIAAAGRAGMIGAEHIKPGAVVIDVGINVSEDGSLLGDVDYQAASEEAGYITPVPGGVGAVTSTILARNTLNACEHAKWGYSSRPLCHCGLDSSAGD